MYEDLFHLDKRPFQASPNPERFFPASSIESARQTLSRGIDRDEGPGLLIGGAGLGKSLICQVLMRQYRDRLKVLLIDSARITTPRALLQNLLYELGQSYRERDEAELRLELVDHLQKQSSSPKGLLLLIDEAHALPLRLLEELRMLTNLVQEGSSQIRLVLAGAALLEERFASPRLESFAQRIAARCYLHPMNREETESYVQSQIALCGGKVESIFSHDALQAIYVASDGVPRLVNQICDHALVMAAADDRKIIDTAGIEEAWADLQQLPMPAPRHSEATSAAPSAAGGDFIEFGELSDEQPVEVIPDTESLHEVAAERLEAMEQQLQDLDDDDTKSKEAVEGGARETVVMSSPENDAPEVAATADPFGEAFDDEEVLEDHYAALSEKSQQIVDKISVTSVPQAETTADEITKDSEPEMTIKAADGAPTIDDVTQNDCLAEEASPGRSTDEAIADAGVTLSEADAISETTVAEGHVEKEQVEEQVIREHVLRTPNYEIRAKVTRHEPKEEEHEESLSDTAEDAMVAETSIEEKDEDVLEPKATAEDPADDAAPHAAAYEDFVSIEATSPLDREGLPSDDRDLLVIEEHRRESLETTTAPAGRARRQEYRQLFAKLRRN